MRPNLPSKLGLPSIGVGYHSAIAEWTRANLDHFDLLEITVDP
jgi:hypothetical protein